jgi:hypothetical protein
MLSLNRTSSSNRVARQAGDSRARLASRQRATAAEPGGAAAQRERRSEKQASASGASKRMSCDASSACFLTSVRHSSLLSSAE